MSVFSATEASSSLESAPLLLFTLAPLHIADDDNDKEADDDDDNNDDDDKEDDDTVAGAAANACAAISAGVLPGGSGAQRDMTMPDVDRPSNVPAAALYSQLSTGGSLVENDRNCRPGAEVVWMKRSRPTVRTRRPCKRCVMAA
jgi:hypothetical protein